MAAMAGVEWRPWTKALPSLACAFPSSRSARRRHAPSHPPRLGNGQLKYVFLSLLATASCFFGPIDTEVYAARTHVCMNKRQEQGDNVTSSRNCSWSVCKPEIDLEGCRVGESSVKPLMERSRQRKQPESTVWIACEICC